MSVSTPAFTGGTITRDLTLSGCKIVAGGNKVTTLGAATAAGDAVSLDISQLIPLAQIPATLTGKDADTVDTYHAAGLIPVVNTVKKTTDVFSTTSTSYVDVTGFTITFTPAASSKLLIILTGNTCNATAGNDNYFKILEGATIVGYTHIYCETASKYRVISVITVRNGTGASTTYKVQMAVQAGTGKIPLNTASYLDQADFVVVELKQ
jgi:hypothetical protein